jgi:hypothetical protein
MLDSPPLIFAPVLGSLRPANKFAEETVKAISGPVVVKISKATANQRRRGYYWVLLGVAAEVLQDRDGQPWDAELLHRELKIALGLGEILVTPSGRQVFKARSTSDAKMTEPQRAHWLDRVSNTLSQWTGVPAADLMQEARERDARIGETP